MEWTSRQQELREHGFLNRLAPFDIVTIAYILFTFIYIIIGINKIPQPFFHLGIRLGILLLIAGIIFIYDRFPNTVTAFIRNFYPLALLGIWYTETYAFHGVVFGYLDPHIVRWESFLFGIQPSLEFSRVFAQRWFSELLCFGYFSFYELIFLVCLIVYLSRRKSFNEVIYTVLFSFYLFYIVFAIVPSMGPHYWFHIPDTEIPGGYIFADAVKLAQDIGEKPTGAFPSSHVGISVLILCLCFRYIRRWFYVFLPIVIVLCVATVYIKAHYLLDVISGIACVPVLLWLSRLTFSRFPSKEYYPVFESRNNKTD
jgi:membrane-associated phospholipid phosphatase